MRNPLVTGCVFLSLCGASFGDTLQLENGDTLNGKVLSVTDQEVKIQSDVHGQLTLPRQKVVAIVLGNPAPRAAKPAAGKGAVEEPKESPLDIIRRLVPRNFGPQQVEELARRSPIQGNVETALQQLRGEGLDPKVLDELHLRLPGFGSPKVQQYFHDRVQGLRTGRLSIQDIRKDAKSARDELKALRDDLGQDGAALDGYLGILDNFLQKTAQEYGELPK